MFSLLIMTDLLVCVLDFCKVVFETLLLFVNIQ